MHYFISAASIPLLSPRFQHPHVSFQPHYLSAFSIQFPFEEITYIKVIRGSQIVQFEMNLSQLQKKKYFL